jgi:hypothetical protein
MRENNSRENGGVPCASKNMESRKAGRLWEIKD